MNNHSIRDRLLDLEKRTPEQEERFNREIKKMFEKKLTPSEKKQWIIEFLFLAFFIVLFSYKAIFSQDLSLIARLGYIEGTVFSVAFVALGIWTLKKGSVNKFKQGRIIYFLAYAFVLLLLINMLVLGSQQADKVKGVQLMLYGITFFLCVGISTTVMMSINRAEASIREHLLKIELKMAKLSEKIEHE